MEKETLDLISATTQELLKLLTVEAEFEIGEQEGGVLVKIETPEPGVLIGYHGKTLESLQLLLSQIVYKKLGTWVRLTLTVGDYRDRREKQLKDIAFSAAAEAIRNNEAVYLGALTPGERRIIHLTLSENPEVTTESEGEGKNRRLIVKPKTAK